MIKKGQCINQVMEIKVNSSCHDRVLDYLEKRLKSGQKTMVVTLNPEMAMAAQKDRQLLEVINRADLVIPDGIGIVWALKRQGVKAERITGRELMQALIKKGYTHYLAGGRPGDPDPDIKAINRIKPDLLFVGLGHGKQEKWIAKNLPKLKVKIAMGVGGAIDQLNDPSLVAPACLQACGLEWFYRFLRQPWRLKRQLALLKFLAKIYL